MALIAEHVYTNGNGNTGRLQIHADATNINDDTVRVRAYVVFVSSGAITDTSNTIDFNGGGAFSNESGARSISHGSGGGTTWLVDQTRDIARVWGSNPSVGLWVSLSGLNIFGITFSTSGTWTGDAKPAYPPGPPSYPPQLYQILTATTARLAWGGTTAANGAQPYEDQLIVRRVADSVDVHNSTQGGNIRDVSGLSPHTVYRGYARIHNAAGWSSFAQGADWRTLSLPPTLTVVSRTSTSFTIQCEPPAGTPLGDVQQWEITTADSGGANAVATNGRTQTRTGLARARTYAARLRLYTAAGWSDYSSWFGVTTLADPPVIAAGYAVSSIAGNSATVGNLSVSDNGGESPTDVAVEYSTNSSLTGATRKERGSWADVPLTGLLGSTTYYYRAQAKNSGGWGTWGPVKSFTTMSGVPDDIATPTVSAITDTGLTMTWAAPAMNGATLTNYQWQWSLDDSFNIVGGQGSTTSLSAALTGLPKGTRVFLRVRAIASPGNGGWGGTSARTTGVDQNGGMRVFALVDGVVRQGDLYAFVGGTRRKLKPMALVSGTIQTD